MNLLKWLFADAPKCGDEKCTESHHKYIEPLVKQLEEAKRHYEDIVKKVCEDAKREIDDFMSEQESKPKYKLQICTDSQVFLTDVFEPRAVHHHHPGPSSYYYDHRISEFERQIQEYNEKRMRYWSTVAKQTSLEIAKQTALAITSRTEGSYYHEKSKTHIPYRTITSVKEIEVHIADDEADL